MSLIKNRAFISQLNYNQNKKNVIIIIELQKIRAVQSNQF